MMNYNALFELANTVGAENAKARKIIADLEELAKRESATRAELLSVDPKSKDYREKSLDASTLILALKEQSDALNAALEDELNAMKAKAVSEPKLDGMVSKAAKLDEEIVQHLVAAYRAFMARHVLTEEHGRIIDRLAEWALELGMEAPKRLKTAWGETWNGDWREGLRRHLERFLALAGNGVPEDAKNLMGWFTRRIW